MQFCVTNDVEEHSIALNRLDDDTAWRVYREGMPRLLDLYSKFDVKGTFYFTGTFVEKIPEAVDLVLDYDHEIGCHGYSHEIDRGFDMLDPREQVIELERAKRVIESVAGPIEAFRAPAARINEHTIRALEKTDFKTDSSICSQRFDGPLTFGSAIKLNWLFAPRMPYHPDRKNPFIIGDSNILEIPISASVLGYVGTTMRVAPMVFGVLQRYIFREAKETGKPVVFVFHPVEVIEPGNSLGTHRRANGMMEYVFADLIRHRLKLRNLGLPALNQMEKVLREGRQAGFEFISIRDYRKRFGS